MKRVAVVGATGMMGEKFVERLSGHPWFKVAAVAGSEKTIGKTYAEALGPRGGELPESVRSLEVVSPSLKGFDADIVFSALPSDVAGPIEEELARAGYPVFTNASSHRMDEDVPLLIPEVNVEHTLLIERQRRGRKWDGLIVANPNCTTTILTLSLKPVYDEFGLETVVVSSMQAVSGAGYPGVSSLDILDNVIPYIPQEEEKVERETRKILGGASGPADVRVSASCHRVPTMHGHMEAVFVKTKSQAEPARVVEAMKDFRSTPQRLRLPSAPEKPILVSPEKDRPQTRLDVDNGGGMAVSVGRVRVDSVLQGVKYLVLGHNLVRGGAGCSILNAELLLAQKYIV